VIEGESWDAIAHAELALAASGTVTVEAALLGTPMVTFYKVTTPSWIAGKLLVNGAKFKKAALQLLPRGPQPEEDLNAEIKEASQSAQRRQPRAKRPSVVFSVTSVSPP
jgi:predicted glycosyltransferase